MPQRTVILGAGISGLGSAILAQKLGHDVFVSDYGIIQESVKKELA
jgi:UDP-N-acetylmuramoylalanine--D-glutamate ligase